MCDHCHPPGPLSRRDLLKAAALTAAAAFAGCQPTSTTTPLASTDEQLEGEAPKSPIITDTRPIIVPPPVPPKRTDYGDILPRHAWTIVPMEYGRGRPMNGVQRITIHHSGDGKPFLATSVADTARHLQSVQRAHFQRGMIDIAYHFAIDRAGRAWQLRSLLYEGQHVRIGQNGTRWNEHNLGIVTLGDFNLQSPTSAQFTRLLAFVRLVQQKYALPTTMIRMHGELVQTDCPGQHLAPLIRTARKQKSSLIFTSSNFKEKSMISGILRRFRAASRAFKASLSEQAQRDASRLLFELSQDHYACIVNREGVRLDARYGKLVNALYMLHASTGMTFGTWREITVNFPPYSEMPKDRQACVDWVLLLLGQEKSLP